MRRSTGIFSSAIVLTAVGVVAFAAPANAVDTPVSVQVTGGVLSISAPTANIVVPALVATSTAQAFNVSLGDVVVSDAIGGTAGWAVSVAATTFTTDPAVLPVRTIPLTGAVYSSVAQAPTGDVALTLTDSTALGATTTIATAIASGVNTAGWTPTLAVVVPAGTLAGEYASVVTHSLL